MTLPLAERIPPPCDGALMANRNPSFAKMHHCVHKARVWAEGCDVALAAVLSGGREGGERRSGAHSLRPAHLHAGGAPEPQSASAPSQTPAVARLPACPRMPHPPTHPPARARTHPPLRAAARPSSPRPCRRLTRSVCASLRLASPFPPVDSPYHRPSRPRPPRSIDPPEASNQEEFSRAVFRAGTRVSVFWRAARAFPPRVIGAPSGARPTQTARPPAPHDRVSKGMAGRGEANPIKP